VLAKLTVIVAARCSAEQVPRLLDTITRRDVPSMWAAEASTKLFFDQRRLLPTDPEALFFDGALLVFTAVEWYICGVVIEWVLKRRRGKRKAAAQPERPESASTSPFALLPFPFAFPFPAVSTPKR
jgi:hypothetical protein